MNENTFLAHVFGYRRTDWVCCSAPTGKDVMRVFFFYINECGLSVHEGAVTVARKLRAEWLENNRQTMTEFNVVGKIKSRYAEYCRLRKSFRRGGESFWRKVGELKGKLVEVFNIASGSSAGTSRPPKSTKR